MRYRLLRSRPCPRQVPARWSSCAYVGCAQAGHELAIPIESESELNAAFARFKELADRKSEIYDEDIQALFSDETVTPHDEHFKLLSLSQRSETGERPHALMESSAHIGKIALAVGPDADARPS